MRIELIYFDGCPHASTARERLREALRRAAVSAPVQEWLQDDPAAPAYALGYGSPTVLVNGLDVTGAGETGTGAACRADGAPSLELLVRALRGGA